MNIIFRDEHLTQIPGHRVRILKRQPPPVNHNRRRVTEKGDFFSLKNPRCVGRNGILVSGRPEYQGQPGLVKDGSYTIW